VDALEVTALRVTYRRRNHAPVDAVQDVSLRAASGEILGLLGPNGAGKTSTLEVCEGFRPRSGGEVRVLGRDPGVRSELIALRSEIGIMLQEAAIEPHLTVAEVVRRNARYYPRSRRLAETLELVGLTAQADTRVSALSGGQQRRLDLALAIVGRPKLLFLDEPTTGFDPPARREAWRALRRLAAEGTSVVLTTHYLEEAEQLCDRVAILLEGRIIAEGPPASLQDRHSGPAILHFTMPAGPHPIVLPGDTLTLDGTQATLRAQDPTRALHSLTGWALQRGLRLDDLDVRRPTLEDVYLSLLGHTA
jgi:ABC-2 type transport system ATP-binding protein